MPACSLQGTERLIATRCNTRGRALAAENIHRAEHARWQIPPHVGFDCVDNTLTAKLKRLARKQLQKKI